MPASCQHRYAGQFTRLLSLPDSNMLNRISPSLLNCMVCCDVPNVSVAHDGRHGLSAVQGEMPPTAKQYMETIAARLLIRNLHLALPSLLPRLTNYEHRCCLSHHPCLC